MDKSEGRKPGRPPWTEEQRQAYNDTISKRREERKAKKEAELANPKPVSMRGKKGVGKGNPYANKNTVWSRYKEFKENPENHEIICRLMTETLHSYTKPRVTSDEEMAERFAEFYHECAETGKIPTLEELYICTGYAFSTVDEFLTGRRKGFSPETKNVIRRARDFMKTFDAKLVVSGEVNPVVYFFRAKNYYNMKDQQDVVVQAGTDRLSEMSDAEIEKWYLEDGNGVDTKFVEDEE